MLTLSLLRHAKSSWGDATLADVDRPLNERGRDAAPRMGALMRREGLRPDHVLCSPAARTRQTLDLIRGEPDALPAAVFDDRLYHATPTTLLRIVHEVADTARHILVVGHNPGLQQFATGWLRPAPPASANHSRTNLPTGALVVMTFEIERWRDLRPGTGHLRLFARPRDELDA